ncbi:hypothetical protein ACFQZ4_10680 [Catellatospora coxensis]
MSEHHERQAEPVERTGEEVRTNWVQRRRDKIYNEISANRRGESPCRPGCLPPCSGCSWRAGSR